ncbi:PWWP domain-containing protein 2A isoform 1-T2 [Discoglossus pictus]
MEENIPERPQVPFVGSMAETIPESVVAPIEDSMAESVEAPIEDSVAESVEAPPEESMVETTPERAEVPFEESMAGIRPARVGESVSEITPVGVEQATEEIMSGNAIAEAGEPFGYSMSPTNPGEVEQPVQESMEDIISLDTEKLTEDKMSEIVHAEVEQPCEEGMVGIIPTLDVTLTEDCVPEITYEDLEKLPKDSMAETLPTEVEHASKNFIAVLDQTAEERMAELIPEELEKLPEKTLADILSLGVEQPCEENRSDRITAGVEMYTEQSMSETLSESVGLSSAESSTEIIPMPEDVLADESRAGIIPACVDYATAESISEIIPSAVEMDTEDSTSEFTTAGIALPTKCVLKIIPGGGELPADECIPEFIRTGDQPTEVNIPAIIPVGVERSNEVSIPDFSATVKGTQIEQHIPVFMPAGKEVSTGESIPELISVGVEQKPQLDSDDMENNSASSSEVCDRGYIAEDIDCVSEQAKEVGQVHGPVFDQQMALSELLLKFRDIKQDSEEKEFVLKTEPANGIVCGPVCEEMDPVPESLDLEIQHDPEPACVQRGCIVQLDSDMLHQDHDNLCSEGQDQGSTVLENKEPILEHIEKESSINSNIHGVTFHLIPKETSVQLDFIHEEIENRCVQLTAEMNCDPVHKVTSSDHFLEGEPTPGNIAPSPGLNTLGRDVSDGTILMDNSKNIFDLSTIGPLSGETGHEQFFRDTNCPQVVPEQNVSLLGEEHAPMALSKITETESNAELNMEEPMLCSSSVPDSAIAVNEAPAVSGEMDHLIPGSEVQVTLDHIIQDALVVSFRLGERIFSGVLMDLSKRFGPHGIPVTVLPKRDYKSKTEAPVQVQSKTLQEESALKGEENSVVPEDVASTQSSEPCEVQKLWTSKPPPLFHEGAPYPPPLFIRDTYNQSIPQPPPRKIKRPKKKIYREEPTSIMNAIKLRPRQVLCDKCKNNVVADKKEVRKVGNDSFKQEDGKRRRHESVTTVSKRLKTDHKVNGKSQTESHKRSVVTKVSNITHSRRKVVKVSSQTKAHLHTKKVLQSKNMDHAKAREVLKMAKEKAHKKQKATSSSKNSHSKVHYTRRLQNTSSGTLPPRLRIKPQRYRNEENDSSLKTGLESLRSSKMGIKPQTRYTATRSAGEAPSEIKTPSNGPEEVKSEIQDTSVCVPTEEQETEQALGKKGSKTNITVYMTLNQKKVDSSTASVCSSDSTDDLKSIHSECSSTENFDIPPGSMHAPSSSSSSSSKEEKKLSNSLKIKVFSKNVSKCLTLDGRTICVGDIVWAKIYGFPWWPARILAITVSRKDNGLLVRQEARISWFGSPTTSFLGLSQLAPFLENFQSRFNKKRKGLYRKAITEAAKAAKQLTPEVRALLTQFET